MVRKLTFILLTCLLATSVAGQSSVLKSGKWYKVSVDKNGVYRLSYDQLKKMGFANADPKTIKVFGQEGGMLPQPNSEPRPSDLIELSILMNGESDGKLNSGDYLLFYGEGPDHKNFITSKRVFYHEHNLYSKANYYFITAGGDQGKRITNREPGIGGVLTNTFEDYVHYEQDLTKAPISGGTQLESGREWFGENFSFSSEQVFNLDIEGILPGAATFVSDVMAGSINSTTFEFFFNDQLVGQQTVPAIINSTYANKGNMKRDSVIFSLVPTSSARQSVRYTYNKGASSESKGFLNFFSIHFSRKLALYGAQTIFRSYLNTTSDCRFSIDKVNGGSSIWDISDFYHPINQSFAIENSQAIFTSPAGEIAREYIVFNRSYLSPQLIGEVPNQDLHGLSPAHYIVITHPLFKAEATRLAQHRASLNNWSTAVVTPEEIYNEFSSGRQDITAIRDFIRNIYLKNPATVKAVLLMGKGSYDYLDRIKDNTNFVPIYESRNSLSPLESYSSDDYYGFMDDQEGEWPENRSGTVHNMEFGVGRIPVKTAQEAADVVDKLIAYDLGENRFGGWRKDFVFVADDGSTSDNWTSIHQSQANSLAETIEAAHPNINTRKIFLGTYHKDVYPYGERIPLVNSEISREFNKSLIINYTGHGNEEVWADEFVLTNEDIDKLKNKYLPFLVTATCEFGRHDSPSVISGAERTLLKEKSGSIGLVTTARPVNSSTNFALNSAFYEALFSTEEVMTMGEIFMLTKNNSTSGVSNRNFSLLGDPGLRLALPGLNIVIDEISTTSGTGTLKALSNATIKGHIADANGSQFNSFNGTVTVKLFDKKTPFKTIGKNNPAYEYTEWFNPLFNGRAEVQSGSFEIDFIVPKNIEYQNGPGKLSLYAFNKEKTLEASGGTTSFVVGGSEDTQGTDTTSPVLAVFMGDTTFIDGGRVNPNTQLVVKLHDENGINISNYGIGNTAMAVLDDDAATFILNEYYEASSGTYTDGWIYYPLENLAPGPHTLTVKIWDSYNNPAEKSINFVVTEGNLLQIEEFANYPNPFDVSTTFYFVHNRPGDDLEVTLQVLNIAGQWLKDIHLMIPSSSYKQTVLFEDMSSLGQKLTPGLYFGRVFVRSLTDGGESSAVTKLIVSN